jgi:hypothetical protein
MSDSLGYISCAVAVGAVGATYLLSQSLREDEEDDMLSDSLPTAKRKIYNALFGLDSY